MLNLTCTDCKVTLNKYADFVSHLVTPLHQNRVRRHPTKGPLQNDDEMTNRYVVLGISSFTLLEVIGALQNFGIVTEAVSHIRENCLAVTLEHFDYRPFQTQ